MISILCPSRARIDMLKTSLASLGEGDFEILVYVDEDDPKLWEYMEEFKHKHTLVVGKRVGYKNFHVMVNELAKLAKGDYLLLWNDDAIMMTPNWWEKLPAEHRPVVVFNFNAAPQMNLFPLITREMYETMGHFSLSTHCDSWVQDIANELGIHVYVPGVEVRHIRDQVWDQTKAESQGAYAETSPLHSSPEMQRLMEVDKNKIKEKL